jgi:hypothetical protein
MEHMVQTFMEWWALKVEKRPILAVASTAIAILLTIGVLTFAMVLLVRPVS